MRKAEILRQTDDGMDVFRNFMSGYKNTHASFNIYCDRYSSACHSKDSDNPDYDGDCSLLAAMMGGRNCADYADFVFVMKTKAHDMNLFHSMKSEAGHDCVSFTVLVPVSARTFFTIHAIMPIGTGIDEWDKRSLT